jgi:DNA replication and repair protein RecF
MFIEALALQNYRNFKEERFRFREAKTVVCGENGHGKSNLLEAIYFFAVAKSGRGSPDRDIVRHGATHFKIQSSIRKGSSGVSLQVHYDQQSGKRAFVGENPLPRLSDLLGTFNAVLFSPEDVDLVLRSPHERRRMLDILASQASVSYLSDLQNYQRTLAQRNRLLKAGLPSPGAEAQLRPWDLQLAAAGARIIRYRLKTVERIGPSACGYYGSVSPDGERLRVCYQSRLLRDTVEGIQDAFLEDLERQRGRELALRYTAVGPHRDQLIFEIGGEDAQRHASQGQMKSILLSWKLAEAVFLASEAGENPVLLLDDIFSELDSGRSVRLLGLLRQFDQVILTTARDPDLRIEEYERIVV